MMDADFKGMERRHSIPGSATLHILRKIAEHPLTRGRKWDAVRRLVRWKVASMVMGYDTIVPFVDDTNIVLSKGRTASVNNWFFGLMEFDDMAFALHCLSCGDLFVDIGANIGAYSLIAGGGAGANVVAFEPVPSTFAMLSRNIAINGLNDRVTTHNIGLGDAAGELVFTVSNDALNRVVTEGEDTDDAVTEVLPVRTLDEMLDGQVPDVMKIDVEGWEPSVLNGAHTTLDGADLKAIIMETRPGFGSDRLDKARGIVETHGFQPYTYDGKAHALKAGIGKVNTIFIRGLEAVEQRIANAKTYQTVAGRV